MSWKNVQYENGKYRTSEGGGGGSSTFANLEDVSFDNLQNGQVPKYNSETQKWENADESGGGTVTDVKVNGQSVVDPQTGEAEITMPTPPTIPVEDVEVNGESVVNAQKVAQIKSYKEVTQSEYNALPASKTSDDILYCIKDSAGADGFPPLIYSDEEREVGVWRDGKPLYQKTFTKVINATDSNTELISASEMPNFNIEFIDGHIGGFSLNCYFENNGYTKVWGYNDGPVYYRYRLWGGTELTAVVTLYYTKTTDTPGSGTWTTQGALSHHYSTDEHIIGTWIDGKPIYEKTIVKNNIAVTPPDGHVAHGIQNVDMVIRLNVLTFNSNSPTSYTSESGGLSFTGGSSTTIMNGFRVDRTNIMFIGKAGSGEWSADVNRYWYFTIQYTKTTD